MTSSLVFLSIPLLTRNPEVCSDGSYWQPRQSNGSQDKMEELKLTLTADQAALMLSILGAHRQVLIASAGPKEELERTVDAYNRIFNTLFPMPTDLQFRVVYKGILAHGTSFILARDIGEARAMFEAENPKCAIISIGLEVKL